MEFVKRGWRFLVVVWLVLAPSGLLPTMVESASVVENVEIEQSLRMSV